MTFTERLVRRGYIAPRQLRIDKFDLDKARSDLKVASTKLNALTEYTRHKKLTELDAKVKTSDAKLKSDEAKLALERQKLSIFVRSDHQMRGHGAGGWTSHLRSRARQLAWRRVPNQTRHGHP